MMFRVKEPDAATVLRPGTSVLVGRALFAGFVASFCFPAVGRAIASGGDVRPAIWIGLVGTLLVCWATRMAFNHVKFSGDVIAWTTTFRDRTANRSDVLGFEIIRLRGTGQATVQMHFVGRRPVQLPVVHPNNAGGAAELQRMQALLESWRVGT